MAQHTEFRMGNKSQGCWKGREPRQEGEAMQRAALVRAEGVLGFPRAPAEEGAAWQRLNCGEGALMHVQTCTSERVPVLHAAGNGAADALPLSMSPELPRPKQAASPQLRSASKPGGRGSMESQPLALTVDISKGTIPAP